MLLQVLQNHPSLYNLPAEFNHGNEKGQGGQGMIPRQERRRNECPMTHGYSR